MKKIFIFIFILTLWSSGVSAQVLDPANPYDVPTLENTVPVSGGTMANPNYQIEGSFRPLEPGDSGYTGPTYSNLDINSNTNSNLGASRGYSGTAGSFGSGISGACSIRSIDSIANCAISIINTILYFLMSGALLYTMWAAFKLVKNGDSADGRASAREQIIAGIIALAVMSSVWGLVAILTTTFGLSGGTPVAPPQIRI